MANTRRQSNYFVVVQFYRKLVEFRLKNSNFESWLPRLKKVIESDEKSCKNFLYILEQKLMCTFFLYILQKVSHTFCTYLRKFHILFGRYWGSALHFPSVPSLSYLYWRLSKFFGTVWAFDWSLVWAVPSSVHTAEKFTVSYPVNYCLGYCQLSWNILSDIVSYRIRYCQILWDNFSYRQLSWNILSVIVRPTLNVGYDYYPIESHSTAIA